MILANTKDPNLSKLFPDPIWQKALSWIRENAQAAPLGIHELQGNLMYVNVMSYSSEPRDQCRYESHQQYIDLQYTIQGVEGIDYRNRSELENDGDYDPEKDLQFHHPKEATATLPISGDLFAVFFPEDAHRPKVAIGEPGQLKKLVVKIHLSLLEK